LPNPIWFTTSTIIWWEWYEIVITGKKTTRWYGQKVFEILKI
jgi:hypothetical protein